MSDYYDVIVVGAGPAGSMAAKAAAEGGAKTLLLERKPNIGTPVRCGEVVVKESITQLVEANPKFIASVIKKGFLHLTEKTDLEVIAHNNQTVLVLDRSIFDRHLAELSAEAGADIQTRASVDNLIISDDTVKGITYTRLGKSHKLHAAVVIGADGIESRVGRFAGIKTQLSADSLGSTYQKTLTNLSFDDEAGHIYVGREVAPYGCLWIFPKNQNTANVGIAVSGKHCLPQTTYDRLNSFIKRHFGNPSIIGECASGVPADKPLKELVKNGLLLAGDAGHLCNPLLGAGIFTAMLSGHHAGLVAAECVAKGDVSFKALKVYLTRIEKTIISPHSHALRISRVIRKLDDEVLLKIGQTVQTIPVAERNLTNLLLKGFASQPKLLFSIMRGFL